MSWTESGCWRPEPDVDYKRYRLRGSDPNVEDRIRMSRTGPDVGGRILKSRTKFLSLGSDPETCDYSLRYKYDEKKYVLMP
jgi:hypothetical protein